MSDTQWPRFMVFQQAEHGEPILYNGSVHAPDIEMAMLNARDVFVRRPEASQLWVVPADAIYSKTREELSEPIAKEAQPPAAIPNPSPVIARRAKHDEAIPHKDLQAFYIFGKLSQPSQAELLGEVKTNSAEAALELGIEKFSDREVLRWWIFPVSAVVKSSAKDADSMFATARDRKFTDQAEYPVVTLMRELRAKTTRAK